MALQLQTKFLRDRHQVTRSRASSSLLCFLEAQQAFNFLNHSLHSYSFNCTSGHMVIEVKHVNISWPV